MSCPNPDTNSRDAILAMVMETAADLTLGWDRAFADPIGPDTMLVANLGCQSLDIIVLTAEMSRQLKQSDLPFERLLRADGRPVADISLGALADFLWEHSCASDCSAGARQGA